MRARNRKTGAEIVAMAQQVIGTIGVTDDGFTLDEHNRTAVETTPTKMCWNKCKPQEHNGGYVFMDSNKEVVGENDIELYDAVTGTVTRPTVQTREDDLEELEHLRDFVSRL